MPDLALINNFQKELASMNVSSYFNNDSEKVAKFKRTLFDLFTSRPDLQECPVDSIIEAAKKVAMLNLTLGGDVDIIPRRNRKGEVPQAKAEINYKGYITLTSKAGIVCRANAVYANDIFDVDLAEGTIQHKPNMFEERGDVIGYYAIVDYRGQRVIDVMSQKELQKWKTQYLGQYPSPAWRNSETEMAKKTILKRTVKPYLYASGQNQLIEATDADNDGETNGGRTLEAKTTTNSADVKNIQVDINSLRAKLPPAESKTAETVEEVPKDTKKTEPQEDTNENQNINNINNISKNTSKITDEQFAIRAKALADLGMKLDENKVKFVLIADPRLAIDADLVSTMGESEWQERIKGSAKKIQEAIDLKILKEKTQEEPKKDNIEPPFPPNNGTAPDGSLIPPAKNPNYTM